MRFTGLMLVAVIGLLNGSALADDKTFPKPKTPSGFRLDYCLTWASNCGQPAADKYCELRGFSSATDFESSSGSTPVGPTQVISNGRVCVGNGCTGFSYITCSRSEAAPPPPPPPPPPGPPPGAPPTGTTYKTFSKPKLNGKRVDFCETPFNGCGQDAADGFCDAKGFDEAKTFTASPPLPPGGTHYVGNDEACDGPVCKGFSKIICQKSP